MPATTQTVAARIVTFEPHEPITNPYVRNEFMWDRMGDVQWDVLRSALAAARKVNDNPGQFPRADFAATERAEQEIGDFLFLHMRDVA